MISPPRAFLPFVLVLALSAGSAVRAVPDVDNRAEMEADLAKKILQRASFPMSDEVTGAAQPENNFVMLPDPVNDNLLYVGVFKKGVMPSSPTRQSSGLTEPIKVCDFCNPKACKNEQPYPNALGGEDGYQCGLSDEENPAAEYTCSVLNVPKDDDGDVSFVGTIENPCPCDRGDDDDSDGDTAQRRLLADDFDDAASFVRRLLRRSDSRTRRNRQTHNRSGSVGGSRAVRRVI